VPKSFLSIHSFVTSKNIKWCRFIWATFYSKPEHNTHNLGDMLKVWQRLNGYHDLKFPHLSLILSQRSRNFVWYREGNLDGNFDLVGELIDFSEEHCLPASQQ